MKNIYIVLTYTGTALSKIIKSYTKKEYSHVSLSLDKNLDELYSFGRKRAYNPIIAGLVHEGINFGTFKRFKNTVTEIYELEVTDEQYKIIKDKIHEMYKEKDKYKFNIIGLLLVPTKKKFIKKNYYYCAEFVKYILEEAKVDINPVNDIPQPMQFRNIKNLKLIYTGLLKNYKN